MIIHLIHACLRVFRKHLEGGIIKSIKQIGNDRRIEIEIKSKDEIGDIIYRTVILQVWVNVVTIK